MSIFVSWIPLFFFKICHDALRLINSRECVEMSIFRKKLNAWLKTCVLAIGVSSISFSVSAFELYQGEVVLFGGTASKDKEVVVLPSKGVADKGVVMPSPEDLKPSEPRSGEVVLKSSLPVWNHHSEVRVLPQDNEVQFLDQSERKALLTILSHLQQADGLIQRAQVYQRPDQRIKFRYDWLRHDLHKINRSILDHLNSPENQTRFFEPLNDDYRR